MYSEFIGKNDFTVAFDSLDTFLMILKCFVGFLSECLKDILIVLSISILFMHFSEAIIFESVVG